MICAFCQQEDPQIFFCGACQKLRPLLPAHTYFEALGVQPSFPIDTADLEAAYEERMLSLHPDYFTQEDAEQRALSEDYAARLRMAKDLLSDPFSLAVYMVENAGYHLPALQPDQAFLIEILEIQEAVTAAETYAELDPAWVEKLESSYQKNIQQLSDALKPLYDPKAQGALDLKKTSAALTEFRYWQNIHKALEDLLTH